MGKVFFPLDEELELLPGQLAPRQQRHLASLACFMPFHKVVGMLSDLVSVQVNEETVRRLTEQAGSWMEAAQTAEVETEGTPESEEQQPPQRSVISPDGAMISLVHKQWAETRTVAIGEPQEKRNALGETEIHVGNLSYFSRLADASTFTKLAKLEIQRRQVAQAKAVGAVMDGADWLQGFIDTHRPDAVRILDFPHAAEHITKLLEALEQAGMQFPPHMLDRCLHILKHRGPHFLLRMADRLESNLAERKGVREHLDYLRKREEFMQYPKYRHDGWPIGSGMVESANKNVVEARLKGTGMHWERKNVNPMLALRNAVCNDRWKEMWQKAVLQQRKQQAEIRSERVEQRAQALLVAASGQPFASQSPPSSQEESSSSPSQAISKFLPLPATSSAPVPAAARPGSSHPILRRKQDTVRKRVKYSPHRSSEGSGETCFCGTPLVQETTGRTKQYCSDRCRQHAQRHHLAVLETAPEIILEPDACSSPTSASTNTGTCPCGASLAQPQSLYCSHRCRQRAYRQRHAKAGGNGMRASAEIQRPEPANQATCPCGAPLAHPNSRYCSHRCRQRAYRQRHMA